MRLTYNTCNDSTKGTVYLDFARLTYFEFWFIKRVLRNVFTRTARDQNSRLHSFTAPNELTGLLVRARHAWPSLCLSTLVKEIRPENVNRLPPTRCVSIQRVLRATLQYESKCVEINETRLKLVRLESWKKVCKILRTYFCKSRWVSSFFFLTIIVSSFPTNFKESSVFNSRTLYIYRYRFAVN